MFEAGSLFGSKSWLFVSIGSEVYVNLLMANIHVSCDYNMFAFAF